MNLIFRQIFQNKKIINVVPTSGLVSYYKLNEVSGSTLYDSHGTDHFTTLISIGLNETGKIDKCIKWLNTASDAYTTTASTITGNFSINLWLYRQASTPAVNTGLFEIGGYNTNTGFGIWIQGGEVLQWRVGNSYNNAPAGTYIPLNTWTMISMVYDGATVKFYQDGNPVTSSVRTINPAASPNRHIYRRSDNGESGFRGKIDEIALYNRAITSTEILALYNLGDGITL